MARGGWFRAWMIAEDGRRRRTQNDLGDPLVLVDDATEDIATNNGTGPLRFASRVRRDELKSAMWPSFVVMPNVLAHHAFEMSSGDDEQVIETAFSHGLHPSLGERVRLRCPHRRANRLDTDRGEYRVEAAREFGVPVTDEEPESASVLLEVRGRVAFDLGHPRSGRIGRDPETVHDATLDLDDEEHVVAPEQHRVDTEEVRCQDATCLSAKELGPGRTIAPRCWTKTMTAKHAGDAGLRDADAELLQLTDDAEIAPPRVFPREHADELDGLVGKRWPTYSSVRVSPSSFDETPMPVEDRLRRDEKRSPSITGYEMRKKDDERAVGPGEARAFHLASQHRELMGQHEDLGLFRERVADAKTNQLEGATHHAIEKREEHDRGALPGRFSLVKSIAGSNWPLQVVEKFGPAEITQPIARCKTGKRACPPEDCGGISGYAELLEAVADPTHEEHRMYVEWVGRGFEPEVFDLDSINNELGRLGSFLSSNSAAVRLSCTQAATVTVISCGVPLSSGIGSPSASNPAR